VRGVTLLASVATKADPKTMTSAMRLGEEFVAEGSFEAGKSKGALEVRVIYVCMYICIYMYNAVRGGIRG